jgi:hypothetical protein
MRWFNALFGAPDLTPTYYPEHWTREDVDAYRGVAPADDRRDYEAQYEALDMRQPIYVGIDAEGNYYYTNDPNG